MTPYFNYTDPYFYMQFTIIQFNEQSKLPHLQP